MSILESIVLGAIQGIAEWLPVSSEGLIFLVKTNFFNNGESVMDIASLALFLHFGTFLAALFYFRNDVLKILSPKFLIPFFKGEYIKESVVDKVMDLIDKERKENVKLFSFLLISTLISGVFGFALLKIFEHAEEGIENQTKFITMGVGVLLLFTAYLQFKAKNGGDRKIIKLNTGDGLILGFVQGLAALPGLSRSGLTVSTFLLRKFNEETALKLSFLMSLPIVLGGNIVLNINNVFVTWPKLIALFTSFIFGLITIDVLLRVAKKINFAWFVLVFGLLMIVSGFL